MALTRRGLAAMGIEAEKIDEIIALHAETVDALKEERDKYKADAAKLADVQKELDDAKKNGGEVWQAKYDELKKDFDSYRSETEAKQTKAAKETAYRKLLKDAGIAERRLDAVMRVTDVSKIELDTDGRIKDADKLTEGIKTEWADFIATTEQAGAQTATPPAGRGSAAGTKTKEEIMAIKDTAERQRAIAENHDLFGF